MVSESSNEGKLKTEQITRKLAIRSTESSCEDKEKVGFDSLPTNYWNRVKMSKSK